MARSLSQSVLKLRLITKPHPSSSRLLAVRTQSNQPNPSDSSDASSDSSSDPLLRKLEDAIHRIIVRRSAPDWLPFIPGSSYWVPPSTAQSYGLAQLVEKLANPLTSEESMSTTSARGWPSSDYFIKGGSPHPVEVDLISNTSSKSEDEEG
ncbi:uncharacterized protein LOC105773577 [Gossypium raimondii]|uniref:Uncharacterized protein n=1 Tax=Gossypium raimondii TaxID=29730 RepID=A0A0D2QZB5_GOSRA|nr:uncharacterized protein LOC105773577 [Gossypium raimondii]KJB63362.1 hypothetical protein B456_010G142600 [Gossypium raimondii]MBA0598029.1 hypothetical protein [Gossypium raimondii]